MTSENFRRLDALASQLTETLMTAAICALEIRAIARAESDHETHVQPTRQAAPLASDLAHDQQRPLLDESTLSVIWKSRVLHLGHTLSFRLLTRLSRRPNQYVTHVDLLRDVWDDAEKLTATATIRSLVRELRDKLRDGGMADLATAIRGHNGAAVAWDSSHKSSAGSVASGMAITPDLNLVYLASG